MSRIIACLLAIVVLSTQAQAALIYLEIDGVEGTSQDDGRKGWIELNSFGLGVHVEGSEGPSSGGAGGVEVIFSDFAFSGMSSAASPEIFGAVVMGTHISSVTLDIVNPGDEKGNAPFAQWELKDVMFTSYSTSASSGMPAPWESYTASFGEITYTYTEFDSEGRILGSASFQWDLVNGTSSTVSKGTVESFEFLTAVPEPGTLSLLVLGGLALIRRRKR